MVRQKSINWHVMIFLYSTRLLCVLFSSASFDSLASVGYMDLKNSMILFKRGLGILLPNRISGTSFA